MPLSTVLCVYARDIFRNQADCDYIAARSNFKLRLRQQFLWSSQQAIEKYLKAILLFNGISARYIDGSTKEFNHKLDKLFHAAQQISELNFSVSSQDKMFIDFLNDQGPNRYINSTAYSSLDALERLDSVIWHIRRYCQSFEISIPIPAERQIAIKHSILSSELDSNYEKNPHLFKLHPGEGGELEKVLKKSHNDPARRALVWANFYFGAKKRTRVRYTSFSSSEIPPKDRGWKNVDWDEVDKYVKP
jgi:hypothetical protein